MVFDKRIMQLTATNGKWITRFRTYRTMKMKELAPNTVLSTVLNTHSSFIGTVQYNLRPHGSIDNIPHLTIWLTHISM